MTMSGDLALLAGMKRVIGESRVATSAVSLRRSASSSASHPRPRPLACSVSARFSLTMGRNSFHNSFSGNGSSSATKGISNGSGDDTMEIQQQNVEGAARIGILSLILMPRSLVAWGDRGRTSSAASVRLHRRALSFPTPLRHPHIAQAPRICSLVRVPPVACVPPSAPESPLEPPSFWQQVKKKFDHLSWKCVTSLVLLLGCTAVGYFANKGEQWALFLVDVLDKSNKAYKPTLEFVVLVIAIIVSLPSK